MFKNEKPAMLTHAESLIISGGFWYSTRTDDAAKWQCSTAHSLGIHNLKCQTRMPTGEQREQRTAEAKRLN